MNTDIRAYTVFTTAGSQPFSFPAFLVGYNTLHSSGDEDMIFHMDGDPERVFKIRNSAVLAYMSEPMPSELEGVNISDIEAMVDAEADA